MKRSHFGVIGTVLALLGWMGSGGALTDVSAHFYGFISGVLLLFFTRQLQPRH